MENPNSTIYQRQNEKRAIILLRASTYCLKKERNIRYYMIAIAILICLFSIFNKYLDKLFPMIPNVKVVSSDLSQAINLVSGCILIANMFLDRLASRVHIEGINLIEMYDNYVFRLPTNKSIMRPISETVIQNYAGKMRRIKDITFKNYYFASPEEANRPNSIYYFQKQQLETEHAVMLNIQPVFLFLWFSFIVIIIVGAVVINDNFLSSLLNILIPSFSAISMIMSSQYCFSENMRILANSINVIRDAEPKQGAENKYTARLFQDGLFNQRMRAFMVPDFMVKRAQKNLDNQTWSDVNTLPYESRMKIHSGKKNRKVPEPEPETEDEDIDIEMLVEETKKKFSIKE